MNQPSRQEVEQVRTKVADVARQAKSDPAYMQKLRDNPRETLLAAGIPDAAANEVLREEGAGDVQGYMGCWFTCMTTNGCSITWST